MFNANQNNTSVAKITRYGAGNYEIKACGTAPQQIAMLGHYLFVISDTFGIPIDKLCESIKASAMLASIEKKYTKNGVCSLYTMD